MCFIFFDCLFPSEFKDSFLQIFQFVPVNFHSYSALGYPIIFRFVINYFNNIVVISRPGSVFLVPGSDVLAPGSDFFALISDFLRF